LLALLMRIREFALLELLLAFTKTTREGESGKVVLHVDSGPFRCVAGAGTEGDEEEGTGTLEADEALEPMPMKFLMPNAMLDAKSDARPTTVPIRPVEDADTGARVGKNPCTADDNDDESAKTV
jgi:hypothetical protein